MVVVVVVYQVAPESIVKIVRDHALSFLRIMEEWIYGVILVRTLNGVAYTSTLLRPLVPDH
jgi:hypothetical protein